MNADLFCRVGAELYGHDWVFALARDLGINRRTLARMANGQNVIHPGTAGDVLRLVKERLAAVEAIAARAPPDNRSALMERADTLGALGEEIAEALAPQRRAG